MINLGEIFRQTVFGLYQLTCMSSFLECFLTDCAAPEFQQFLDNVKARQSAKFGKRFFIFFATMKMRQSVL